jgi:hypothetical protein
LSSSTSYSYKEWSMPTKYESFSDESEGDNVIHMDEAEHYAFEKHQCRSAAPLKHEEEEAR